MKTSERWTKSRTAVHNLGFHIIWCPKYRRKVLTNGIDNKLKQYLVQKANELECDIQQIEVMPDHVHIFIKMQPTLAPHFVIQQLKGYTAHKLREEFPELKSRLPNMWTRSYYIESVGHISEETVRKYIQDQKNK